MNIIEAKNVNFRYIDSCFSLNNINLVIKKGEIVALTGPNGSGKTTLLKILAGILEKFFGEVLINGIDIKKISIKEKAKNFSYVPQMINNIFDFSVSEIIAMGRRPYTNIVGYLNLKNKSFINEVLNYFGLLDKKDKKFSTLSGGEKRLVLIAKAICQDSDIIFLDEPLAYLDLHHQVELIKILFEINKGGKTVFLILHDINIASEICDRLILMTKGSILKSGRPHEILSEDIIKNAYGVHDFVLVKNTITDKLNIQLIYNKKAQEVLK